MTPSLHLPTAVVVELPRQRAPASQAPEVPAARRRSGQRGAAAGADGARAKPARSRRKVMLIVGLAAVFVLLPTCVGLWFLDSRRRTEGDDVILGFAREDAARAWGPENPFNEDQVARDLKPLFSDLGAAFRDRARARALPPISIRRACSTSSQACKPIGPAGK